MEFRRQGTKITQNLFLTLALTVGLVCSFDCYYCSTTRETGVNNAGLDGDCGSTNFDPEMIDKHRNCIGVCVMNTTTTVSTEELVAVDRYCVTHCPNRGECERKGRMRSCYKCCQKDFCNEANSLLPSKWLPLMTSLILLSRCTL